VDGKKVYEITDAGTKFLEEHKDVVSDIFDRVAETVEEALGGSMADLNQGVARLMKTVYRRGWRGSDEVRHKIVDILAKAAKDIEDALA
jgi:DNA-binding PadR family transcriptional regulator